MGVRVSETRPGEQEFIRGVTRGSGRFEKGSGCCGHDRWRIVTTMECRASEMGGGGLVYRPLDSF